MNHDATNTEINKAVAARLRWAAINHFKNGKLELAKAFNEQADEIDPPVVPSNPEIDLGRSQLNGLLDII